MTQKITLALLALALIVGCGETATTPCPTCPPIAPTSECPTCSPTEMSVSGAPIAPFVSLTNRNPSDEELHTFCAPPGYAENITAFRSKFTNLDGDDADEIIVVLFYRRGADYWQYVNVLDWQGDQYIPRRQTHSTPLNREWLWRAENINDISVSVSDVTGNGAAEILVEYNVEGEMGAAVNLAERVVEIYDAALYETWERVIHSHLANHALSTHSQDVMVEVDYGWEDTDGDTTAELVARVTRTSTIEVHDAQSGVPEAGTTMETATEIYKWRGGRYELYTRTIER